MAAVGHPLRQPWVTKNGAAESFFGAATLPVWPRQSQRAAGLRYRSGPVGFRSRGTRGTGCRQVRGGAASGGVAVCIAMAWPSWPPWA